MLNRILILFGNEGDKTNLLEAGKYFNEKYKSEIWGLHIEDLRKFEIVPTSAEGLVADNGTNYLVKKWQENEDQLANLVKLEFEKYFSADHLMIEEGLVGDILEEKLAGFDLVIAQKEKKITVFQKELIKIHYKPLLLIPEGEIKEVKKVLFANDEGVNSNKSLFSFVNTFTGLKDYTSIKVGEEEKKNNELKRYMKAAGKEYKELCLEGNPYELIEEGAKGYDILVMGKLSHSFFLERVTNSTGLKLLEGINIPIYIG